MVGHYYYYLLALLLERMASIYIILALAIARLLRGAEYEMSVSDQVIFVDEIFQDF